MSDHFSGPRAIAGPAGDICDLYAFPSPDQPGRLVLVMNVLPRATASACFSDAIVCRFRLRPLTIAANGGPSTFAVGADEFIFDCTFDAPSSNDGAPPAQRGYCRPPAGEPVAFQVHDERYSERTTTMTAVETTLELDDIQAGTLRGRPSPYAGVYILLRVDDRRAGRELLRRLLPALASAADPADPTRQAWISAALSFQGLKALGVPEDALATFPVEFAVPPDEAGRRLR